MNVKNLGKCEVCRIKIDQSAIRCDFCQKAYILGVIDGSESIKNKVKVFLKKFLIDTK
jgi:hypothetical protein